MKPPLRMSAAWIEAELVARIVPVLTTLPEPALRSSVVAAISEPVVDRSLASAAVR